MLTIGEINKELREIADYDVEVYLDMVYDEFELTRFENERIRLESDIFYDEDAVFLGKNS